MKTLETILTGMAVSGSLLPSSVSEADAIRVQSPHDLSLEAYGLAPLSQQDQRLREIQLVNTASSYPSIFVENYDFGIRWEPKEPLILRGIDISGFDGSYSDGLFASVVVTMHGTGIPPSNKRLFHGTVQPDNQQLLVTDGLDLFPGIDYEVYVHLSGRNGNPFKITLAPLHGQYNQPGSPENIFANEVKGEHIGDNNPFSLAPNWVSLIQFSKTQTAALPLAVPTTFFVEPAASASPYQQREEILVTDNTITTKLGHIQSYGAAFEFRPTESQIGSVLENIIFSEVEVLEGSKVTSVVRLRGYSNTTTGEQLVYDQSYGQTISQNGEMNVIARPNIVLDPNTAYYLIELKIKGERLGEDLFRLAHVNPDPTLLHTGVIQPFFRTFAGQSHFDYFVNPGETAFVPGPYGVTVNYHTTSRLLPTTLILSPPQK